MYAVSFEKARDGSETCLCDGKLLHSKYAPKNEAQKFVSTIEADFFPACVAVLEPALSYCAPFLRTRFPNATLVAIRFSDDFSKTDFLWDKTIQSNDSLSDALFDFLGEEKLCSTLFVDWIPSRSAFKTESIFSWQKIKDAVLKARSVLLTREFFSRRWLMNVAIFAARIKNTSKIECFGNETPIVIACSGPSLLDAIPFLKKNRKNVFLIAVSSAIFPLLEEKIEPDLALSTDGGYWAKKHLDILIKKEIPLALTLEGAAPKKLFKKQIVPLCYDDGSNFERNLLKRLGVNAVLAKRNGTVSGTALFLALSITNGEIFFAGLDQESAQGKQHAEPNALEKINALSDFRLKPKETRTTSARFFSEQSLSIYRAWFSSQKNPEMKRVFRISAKKTFKHSLGSIKDIDMLTFLQKTDGKTNSIFVTPSQKIEIKDRKKIISEELCRAFLDNHFLSEAFPTDFLMIERETDEKRKAEKRVALEEKKAVLKKRLLFVAKNANETDTK